MARNGAGGRRSETARHKRKTKETKAGKKHPRRPVRGLVNYRQMKALSKEERVEIFAILCERIASPKEISEQLDKGLSQVSYHVLVLRQCRLIKLVKTEPRRGAVEHYYRAVAPTLVPPGAWDHLPPAVRKTVSMSILQEFAEDASASIEAGVFDSSPGELSWTPLILDQLGIEEFGQLAKDFLESVLKLQANASKRLPKGNGNVPGATTATVFLASFLSARSLKEGKKASATKRR